MDSNTNYFSVGKIILLLVALVLVGQTVFAQKSDSKSSQKEEKIKVKVTMEKDGKRNSFEKEYKDKNEMENDPQLKAFKEDMGLDNDDAFLPPPPPPGSFAFGNGMMEVNGDHLRRFHFFSDSIEVPPLPPLPFMDEDVLIETMDFPLFPSDSTVRFRFDKDFVGPDSINRGKKHVFIYKGRPGDKFENERIIIRKKISIEDVEGKGSDLKLERLNYFPNPNKGRFHLQFESSGKDPVTVKVHNEKGELVYMDKVDGKDGKYDKQIDLSDKQKGIYFLELNQKGKSIRKKVIIE
jgi:hypothetical protein